MKLTKKIIDFSNDVQEEIEGRLTLLGKEFVRFNDIGRNLYIKCDAENLKAILMNRCGRGCCSDEAIAIITFSANDVIHTSIGINNIRLNKVKVWKDSWYFDEEY